MNLQRFWQKIQFKCFEYILKKYNIEFFLKDHFGNLIKRSHSDNFRYIFTTGNICDAQPAMVAYNHVLKNAKMCFDVGANIGITTLWLAKNSEQVIAFEPIVENVKRLQENIETNYAKNIVVEQKIVSDNDGTKEINFTSAYGHHSMGKPNHSIIIEKRKIQSVTLDNYCKQHRINTIDCLKIDVEGFELEVLKGAETMLKSNQIKCVIFEQSNQQMIENGKDVLEVYNFLSNYGFSIQNTALKMLSPDDILSITIADLLATKTN